MSERSQLVSITISDGIAVITMDDGQNNLISPQMIDQLNAALDEAEREGAVVVLTGRADIFSAGFDLKTLRTGVGNAFKMLIGGFTLASRLLHHPTPVVVACNGHAVAMGCFLLAGADYRIGTAGDYKIQANEVAIGLTVPHTAVELCRSRLKPGYVDRALLLSECFSPETAAEAGFLDQVVSAEALLSTAVDEARRFTALDMEAHRGTKERLRGDTYKRLADALRADKLDFVKLGLKRILKR